MKVSTVLVGVVDLSSVIIGLYKYPPFDVLSGMKVPLFLIQATPLGPQSSNESPARSTSCEFRGEVMSSPAERGRNVSQNRCSEASPVFFSGGISLGGSFSTSIHWSVFCQDVCLFLRSIPATRASTGRNEQYLIRRIEPTMQLSSAKNGSPRSPHQINQLPNSLHIPQTTTQAFDPLNPRAKPTKHQWNALPSTLLPPSFDPLSAGCARVRDRTTPPFTPSSQSSPIDPGRRPARAFEQFEGDLLDQRPRTCTGCRWEGGG